MKTSKVSWLSRVILASALFSFLQGCAHHMEIPSPGTRKPVITNSYAAERGRFGDVLKIYVEADSPDIDMVRIATVVEQPAYGRYPVDWILLKPQYARHFVGYLQWNTSSTNTGYLPEWTQVTLKVSVLDMAGRESNVVVFPYEFVSGVTHILPPPAPFDQGNIPMLGHITVNLYDPGREHGDGDRPRD